MWFSKYKKTDFSGGDLHQDPQPLMETRAFFASPQFVAPRKIDSRDMCLRSSNQGQTPHCFPSHARILMEDLSWMNIIEIKQGMRVVSSDGKPHTVMQNMKRSWQGTMKSIKAIGFSEPIISTQEHPYMIIRRTKKGFKNNINNRKVEWVKAKDIKKGDYIATIGTNLRTIECESIYAFETDSEFLWTIGLYLAEGILWDNDNKDGKRGQIGFCLHLKESHYAKKIITIASRYGFKSRIEKRPKTNTQVVIINSLPWRKWIDDNCKRGSDTKKLSSRILLMPPSSLTNILTGWLDGDGYMESKGRYVGTTVSKELAYQMKLIGSKCGFPSMIRKRKERKDRLPTWDVTIQKSTPGKTTRGFPHNGLYFTPVIQTETISQFNGGTVYNIEVEETHDYVVDFAIVHNCAGYSTAGFIEVFNWRTKHYPEQCDGDLIYTEAKKLDGRPEVNGTILRCAGQGAINANLIKGVVKQVPKTELDIQFAIHTYGVCVAGFLITDEWNLVEKNTGKISVSSRPVQRGGHAVLICGYDLDGVYIQNSWGEDWGIYGFGILSWAQFRTQIMDAMVLVPEIWTPENSVRAA